MKLIITQGDDHFASPRTELVGNYTVPRVGDTVRVDWDGLQAKKMVVREVLHDYVHGVVLVRVGKPDPGQVGCW